MTYSKRSTCNLVHQLLCAALVYAAATAVVHALNAAVVLPPLTQPASGEHHVGKVVWADLVTPDLDTAKRFYGALFGWTFSDVPGDRNYALANVRDFPVPRRHRGVRIELRNRSTFEKGKSHEPSFYAWNRLGKEHVFVARG
jgi:predicted enzyme related to lactoylglutathione lyase